MRSSMLLGLTIFQGLLCTAAEEIRLSGGTRVVFAGVEAAGEALGRRDDFVRSLSPFDRAARLKVGREVSEREFLEFAGKQAREWEQEEKDWVADALGSIGPGLARLELSLPKTILMIKTSGEEEGAAAYTRVEAIVLPQRMIKARMNRLLAHELFHVLSRHDPSLASALYALLGFRPCGEVPYPDELIARKITNPDAPKIEHWIEVRVEGEKVEVVPILFSRAAVYDIERGGKFFDYLQFRLMAVEAGQNQWRPRRRDGELWLLKPGEVSGLIEQVGRGGDFIHPEEVMAGRFAELVTHPAGLELPETLEAMKRVLRQR